MTRRRDLPAPFDASAFRVGRARSAGISRHRIDARDLVRPHHGGRAHRLATLEDRCRALMPLMSSTQAFTGPTAALLMGAPLPLRLERDPRLHVSSLRPQRAMRRPGVVGVERGDGAVGRIRGIPALHAALVWVDLGRRLSIVDLVAVGDRLVSGTLRRPPLCGVEDLAAAVAQRTGSPGVRAARSALPSIRIGSWSRPETFLRLLIVAAGLSEPELNRPIVLSIGRLVVPDLCWPLYRIVIEYDGQWHDDAWDSDADRHEALVDDGWMVVRVRRHELFHAPGALVARLVRRLNQCGYRHPASIDLTRMPRFTA